MFLKEQKRSLSGTRVRNDKFYIDQHIVKESNTKRKNVAMARINKKKDSMDNKVFENVQNIR